ncbi:thioesterase [Actinosynnema pretiosum subsp. pretiosum]|uniref:Thioesterase n=1 Tax=Actinosynnema pretiosum subsp. pretiosum TaxID=103721 RepID=A0AA45R3Y9_9PSEU|nr:Thioesterase [Actinosynnema pretiosum subsp. pretiosum]QUF04080.1 thioesterase [Actinosynnema pretiosum subsp. pretiosum]
MTGGWLAPARPGAVVSLFCLPHAGGSAAAFDRWLAHYPPSVDVRPIRLPGRRERVGEPLITDPVEMTRRLGEALLTTVDRPYALFGHSSGALLAAGTAHWLVEHGARAPELLVVSGMSGRTSGSAEAGERVRAATDARVLATIPEDRELDDPRLRSLVAGVLRADLELGARYRPPPTPLPIAVLALAGERDTVAPPDEVAAWRDRTAAPFRMRVLPGGHDFPYRQAASVAALLIRQPALRDLVG